MRIIVGDGKLSRAFRKPGDVVLSHNDIDIVENPARLAKRLRLAREQLPSLLKEVTVVNTAAKIDLEWCEDNREETWRVNTLGPLNLAEACDILGYKLLHVSSGCVFDGMESGRLYTEEDEPTPASFYASSKAAADSLLMKEKLDVPILIVRPRQILSATPWRTNMLTKFLAAKPNTGFITSQNSVTGIEDLVSMMDHLLGVGATGIYNCACHDTISPYEIAAKLERIRPDLNPQPVEYADYLKRVKVKRVNTILDVSKLQSTGYRTSSAAAVVEWCVENYGRMTCEP